MNHWPHSHEDEESDIEEVASSHHQYCRWHHPHLDWLAEHPSLQTLPLQVP
jgi:hypothetical protein